MSNPLIARRLRASLALSAAVAVAALAGSATASATPVPTSVDHALPASGATTQGIIMRDGGVCDPIRHMGC